MKKTASKKAKAKGDVKVRAKARPPKPPRPPRGLEARVIALEAAVAELKLQLPTATKTSGGEDVSVVTGRVGGSVPLEQQIQADRQTSAQDRLGEKE